MNSLSEFLSSPLLDFIPSNSPSNNIEHPDEIDMLLETLSKSDIQLLDRRVTSDCTSLMSTFAAATETDLKRLKDISD